ncbi:MAG: hypothetical protein GKR87_05820 [Kiritimatiellae bacterium]|nr:hypothetical protein [Kiritimatiellia bacterium]
MKTIETDITVMPNGHGILEDVHELGAVIHHAILVVEEKSVVEKRGDLSDFPVDDHGPWATNISLRCG